MTNLSEKALEAYRIQLKVDGKNIIKDLLNARIENKNQSAVSTVFISTQNLDTDITGFLIFRSIEKKPKIKRIILTQQKIEKIKQERKKKFLADELSMIVAEQ